MMLRKRISYLLFVICSRGIAAESLSPEGLNSLVSYGDIEGVKKVLANGYDINTKSRSGVTALSTIVGSLCREQQASMLKNKEAVFDLLLENKADPNIANDDGFTPLITAAHYGCKNDAISAKITNRLLIAGADPNLKTDRGVTALIAAAESGHVETVKLLIAAKANLHFEAKRKGTALNQARQNKHQEIVNLLEAAGATK